MPTRTKITFFSFLRNTCSWWLRWACKWEECWLAEQWFWHWWFCQFREVLRKALPLVCFVQIWLLSLQWFHHRFQGNSRPRAQCPQWTVFGFHNQPSSPSRGYVPCPLDQKPWLQIIPSFYKVSFRAFLVEVFVGFCGLMRQWEQTSLCMFIWVSLTLYKLQ